MLSSTIVVLFFIALCFVPALLSVLTRALILCYTLFTLNTETNTWLVPETRGATVQGGYGHSSVYDAGSKSVYVHGGYKSLPANKYSLVDDLYRYEVHTRVW